MTDGRQNEKFTISRHLTVESYTVIYAANSHTYYYH